MVILYGIYGIALYGNRTLTDYAKLMWDPVRTAQIGKRNKNQKGRRSNALDLNNNRKKASDWRKLACQLDHQRWELVRHLLRTARNGKRNNNKKDGGVTP